jgi:hypothetical protein
VPAAPQRMTSTGGVGCCKRPEKIEGATAMPWGVCSTGMSHTPTYACGSQAPAGSCKEQRYNYPSLGLAMTRLNGASRSYVVYTYRTGAARSWKDTGRLLCGPRPRRRPRKTGNPQTPGLHVARRASESSEQCAARCIAALGAPEGGTPHCPAELLPPASPPPSSR